MGSRKVCCISVKDSKEGSERSFFSRVPAFPFPCTNERGEDVVSPGLTRLELFAAMAMQGLLAHNGQAFQDAEKIIAERSVKMAHALIDELTKEE